MAARQEDLDARPEAVVYAFPVARVRRAAARERMLVRRRRSVVASIALAAASRPGTPRAVTVRRGDTLWGLATRYAPEGMDARPYLDAVVDLNGLEGTLQEGTRIRLPR